MARVFAISITGTTLTGCVLNSLSFGTSAQRTDARNEKGKVTDIWLYSQDKTVSARGVIEDVDLSGNQAGQLVVIRGETYGVNSFNVDEANNAAATFSLEASRSDDAEIHPLETENAASGGGTSGGGTSGT